MKKIRGLHAHRLKREPEEKRFADAWDDYRGQMLAYLLHEGDQCGLKPKEPSEREHIVAATIVQWLGSSVGQSWLKSLGYRRHATLHTARRACCKSVASAVCGACGRCLAQVESGE